jgi:hypothetical protein
MLIKLRNGNHIKEEFIKAKGLGTSELINHPSK